MLQEFSPGDSHRPGLQQGKKSWHKSTGKNVLERGLHLPGLAGLKNCEFLIPESVQGYLDRVWNNLGE